jgi:hypothetical protein
MVEDERHLAPEHLEAQRLQPVPQGLGQRGRGVEQQVEAGEEALLQPGVGLQLVEQQGIAARHVEIDGGRHFLEVGHRAADQRRRRLALVDMEGAAVAQH